MKLRKTNARVKKAIYETCVGREFYFAQLTERERVPSQGFVARV